MVKQQLDELLEKEGYTKIPSNLPEFIIYFRMENNCVSVLHVIDYREGIYISEDQYVHIKERINALFMEKGIANIHILSLILSTSIDKARHLCKEDSFCWFIDPSEDRLLIYENQVSDFYGMRGVLEQWLQDIPLLEYSGSSKYSEAKREKKKLPLVTISFVVINIIIFLICTFTGDLLYNIGAFSARNIIIHGEYYRIFTCMFLHADINHLFSNMLILYYLGESVEKYFGRLKFGIIYIATGVAGNLLSMGYEIYTNDYVMSVGASGAVFGVIGSLLLLVIVHKGHWEQITLGRLLFMIFYSLYSGFVASNINNAAHIGGFLSGVGIAFVMWLLCRRNMGRRIQR